MVYVHKKDGTLHLGIEYHNKTITDRQPIPKVQDMLDCLGGSSGSLPSIGVRHNNQGHIHPDSRKYIVFSAPWLFYEWIWI